MARELHNLMRRVEIKVSGKVQGIFFRHNAQLVAKSLGLAGYAKNEPDGTVFIVVEGPEDKLKEFISWCRKGPPGAGVSGIEIKWSEATGGYGGFEMY